MFATTVKDFYAKHKDEILKLVGEEHLSDPAKDQLKYQFTSVGGKRYYSYSEQMKKPLSRVVKDQEYMEWMRNGISAEDFKAIRLELVTCMAHINSGSKESKEYSRKAGLLLHEMDLRMDAGLPYNTLLNFLANNLIREDERADRWSSQIHGQKVAEIEIEIDNGNNAFFLILPQLRDLREMQNMSSSELALYLSKLQSEQERQNHILKRILSWKGAGSEVKIPHHP